MRVLVACEISGRVRDAFVRQGHDAWSCDLLGHDDVPADFPVGEFPERHLKMDARTAIHYRGPWDLLIAHPPCTYLTNAGVRWMWNADGTPNRERGQQMIDGALFFRDLLNAPVERVCIENPVMHKYARAWVQEPWTQTIQPYQFGGTDSKRTCLWLRGLPPLVPHVQTISPMDRTQRVWRMPPSEWRWLWRSLTDQAVADAMAKQWGSKEALAA